MGPAVTPTPESVKALADGLTAIQRAAIKGAISVANDWMLTVEYEDHPDIMDDLSEDIADPVSGIFTPLGVALRAHIGASHD